MEKIKDKGDWEDACETQRRKHGRTVSAFFDDLCTVTELMAMQQRLIVAKLLKKGCIYSDIVEKTGASTATISRVNRALSYGKGGYNIILEQLEK